MPIQYFLLMSRQGKLRLDKWFIPLSSKAKAKIVQDLTQLTHSRRQQSCNFIEYKGGKVVYRRYASLFFICQIGDEDNELLTLEIIHRYVEILDQFFGNVCELDLIFNFQQAYAILNELLVAGEIQETSRSTILKMVKGSKEYEESENIVNAMRDAVLY